MTGAPVAEERALTTRQNGGHETAERAQSHVAYRIHAAMDRMEPPGSDAVVDRPLAQPQREELPTSDHTMLQTGKFRDLQRK